MTVYTTETIQPQHRPHCTWPLTPCIQAWRASTSVSSQASSMARSRLPVITPPLPWGEELHCWVEEWLMLMLSHSANDLTRHLIDHSDSLEDAGCYIWPRGGIMVENPVITDGSTWRVIATHQPWQCLPAVHPENPLETLSICRFSLLEVIHTDLCWIGEDSVMYTLHTSQHHVTWTSYSNQQWICVDIHPPAHTGCSQKV